MLNHAIRPPSITANNCCRNKINPNRLNGTLILLKTINPPRAAKPALPLPSSLRRSRLLSQRTPFNQNSSLRRCFCAATKIWAALRSSLKNSCPRISKIRQSFLKPRLTRATATRARPTTDSTLRRKLKLKSADYEPKRSGTGVCLPASTSSTNT
jgi:hypothetical protein